MTIKILNLHAGIGGNRKGWVGEDIEVTAVEYNQEIANVYQEWYPEDKVIVADANEYLAKHYKEFDFIWASPSCTTHSMMRYMASKRGDYNAKLPNMELYSFIVFLQKFFPGKWVVENVKPYYTPLINPTGRLGRHLIWSNFEFEEKDFQDSHIKHNKVTGKSVKYGISLEGIKLKHRKDQIIRNCVNPEISKFLLEEAFKEQSHKSHTLASPTFPTEKAINRNLQVTPSASPKEATLPSVNSDIKLNLAFCLPEVNQMKYRFGIMSQLWELESNDEVLAKVAMCLFYKKDIPIAIYSPVKQAIQPKEILEKNFLHCQKNNEALIQVMDSIIEVKNE